MAIVRKMAIPVRRNLLCIARRPMLRIRFLDWDKFWSTSSTYYMFLQAENKSYSTPSAVDGFTLRAQVRYNAIRNVLSLLKMPANRMIQHTSNATLLVCSKVLDVSLRRSVAFVSL